LDIGWCSTPASKCERGLRPRRIGEKSEDYRHEFGYCSCEIHCEVGDFGAVPAAITRSITSFRAEQKVNNIVTLAKIMTTFCMLQNVIRIKNFVG
jgi:hypothetical protein